MTAHNCMDYRERVVLNEGDDVLHERCARCGRVRFETDGVRPMAWFNVPRQGDEAKGQYPGWVPHTYAYPDPHNDPDVPSPWKLLERVIVPDAEKEGR